MKEPKLKIAKLGKKGSYCLRCGIDKKEIRKADFGCSLYGKSYDNHIYK